MEDPLIITKLKKDYYEFIKSFNYKEKYITDKAPLNFRWIGFIKHLFPGAKIIHCKKENLKIIVYQCLRIYLREV